MYFPVKILIILCRIRLLFSSLWPSFCKSIIKTLAVYLLKLSPGILIYPSRIIFAMVSHWNSSCLLHLNKWNTSHPSPARHLSQTSIIFHYRVAQNPTNKFPQRTHTYTHTNVILTEMYLSSSAWQNHTLQEKKHTMYKVAHARTESFSQTAGSIIQWRTVVAAVTLNWLLLAQTVKSHFLGFCMQVRQVYLDSCLY